MWIIEIVEAHIQEKKMMNKKSIKSAEIILRRAGFQEWQVAAYKGWLRNLSNNRRKWRAMTKKVFGVRVS